MVRASRVLEAIWFLGQYRVKNGRVYPRRWGFFSILLVNPFVHKALELQRQHLGDTGGIGVTRGVTADVRGLPRALGGSLRALAQQ